MSDAKECSECGSDPDAESSGYCPTDSLCTECFACVACDGSC